MDITTSGAEKELGLGAVARTLSETPGLFAPAVEPLILSSRRLRFPTGPAITLREPVAVAEEERDAERWDGLY